MVIFLAVESKSINLETKGEVEMLDITDQVKEVIRESKMKDGIACLFTSSSTSTLTTIEYEPGLLRDFPQALERLFPKNITYQHELRWHDGNGHSHVRASFLKPSLTIPFLDGVPMLGTWQQIVFVELDNKRRSRKVIVQLVGE